MGLQVLQRTLDVGMLQDAEGRAICLRDEPSDREEPQGGSGTLKWFMSLMGETQPEVSPLRGAAATGDVTSYRYDWTFGISCLGSRDLWWDWQAGLHAESAISVQLMVACGEGLGFTEISAHLWSLFPSRNHPLPPAFRAGCPPEIPAGDGQTSHWYVCRFLDGSTGSCAIDWRISRRALAEHGPLLRGAIQLAFHGNVEATSSPAPRIHLLLRPQMNFDPSDELHFSRLADSECPSLVICPRTPAGEYTARG